MIDSCRWIDPVLETSSSSVHHTLMERKVPSVGIVAVCGNGEATPVRLPARGPRHVAADGRLLRRSVSPNRCSSESPSTSLSSPSVVTDRDVGRELQLPAALGAADSVVKPVDVGAACTADFEGRQTATNVQGRRAATNVQGSGGAQ